MSPTCIVGVHLTINSNNANARLSQTTARLFRNLREWLIKTYGVQLADRVIPYFRTGGDKTFDRKSGPSNKAPAAYASADQDGIVIFAEGYRQEVKSTGPERGDYRAVAARALGTAFAEPQQCARLAALLAAIDQLVDQHRIMPYERSAVIAFAQSIDADTILQFGEGNASRTQTAGAWFLEFLKRRPVRPESRFLSMPFDAPRGYTVDRQRLDLYRQSLAYAEQHQVDYLTAVRELS